MTGISHDSDVKESTRFKRCTELRAKLMIITMMMMMMMTMRTMMMLPMIMLTIILPWRNL